MMWQLHRTTENGFIYRCDACGFKTAPTPHPVELVRRCPRCYAQRPLPPLWKRASNVIAAIIKHAKNWFRKCSRAEIEKRVATCEQCELFKPAANRCGYCTHADCGCPISREKRFLNKLAWRDQKCPLGKWPSLL